MGGHNEAGQYFPSGEVRSPIELDYGIIDGVTFPKEVGP